MHKTYTFWWHAFFHHFCTEAKNLQQLWIWINYPIYLNYEFKSLQLLQQFGSNCSSVGFKPTPLNISGSVNWAKRNYRWEHWMPSSLWMIGIHWIPLSFIINDIQFSLYWIPSSLWMIGIAWIPISCIMNDFQLEMLHSTGTSPTLWKIHDMNLKS